MFAVAKGNSLQANAPSCSSSSSSHQPGPAPSAPCPCCQAQAVLGVPVQQWHCSELSFAAPADRAEPLSCPCLCTHECSRGLRSRGVRSGLPRLLPVFGDTTRTTRCLVFLRNKRAWR